AAHARRAALATGRLRQPDEHVVLPDERYPGPLQLETGRENAHADAQEPRKSERGHDAEVHAPEPARADARWRRLRPRASGQVRSVRRLREAAAPHPRVSLGERITGQSMNASRAGLWPAGVDAGATLCRHRPPQL